MDNILNHESIKQIQLYSDFDDIEIRCINFIDGIAYNNIKQFHIKNIDEYIKLLPQLTLMNEELLNYNVYITANSQKIILLDDLNIENLIKLHEKIGIYYAIETSPDNYQAVLYFKSGTEWHNDMYKLFIKYLKFLYGADKACAEDKQRIHRLAGFLYKKEKIFDYSTLSFGVVFRCKLLTDNIFERHIKHENDDIVNEYILKTLIDEDFKAYLNRNRHKKKAKIKNDVNYDNIDKCENKECSNYVNSIYTTQANNKKYKSLSELDLLIFYLCKKKNYKFEEIAAAIKKWRPKKITDTHSNPLNYLQITYNNAGF